MSLRSWLDIRDGTQGSWSWSLSHRVTEEGHARSEITSHTVAVVSTYPLKEVPFDECGCDAVHHVASAPDVRVAEGQPGGLGREASLQVQTDGSMVVSLPLLHLAGLLVLGRVSQPAVVAPTQPVQLWVGLGNIGWVSRGRRLYNRSLIY